MGNLTFGKAIEALKEGKKVDLSDVKKRLTYFNLDISNEGTELSYDPRYSGDLDISTNKDNFLRY